MFIVMQVGSHAEPGIMKTEPQDPAKQEMYFQLMAKRALVTMLFYVKKEVMKQNVKRKRKMPPK